MFLVNCLNIDKEYDTEWKQSVFVIFSPRVNVLNIVSEVFNSTLYFYCP